MRNFAVWLIMIFLFSPQILEAEEIAYSRLTSGYWQIWVMNDQGENKRQLTFSSQDKRDPAWLSQEKIVYRTNNGQLFSVDLFTQSEKQIFARYQNVNTPRTAPDKNLITFARFQPQEKDKSGIWLAQLDSEEGTLLTRDNKLVYQPAISPDGQLVVFVKVDEQNKYHHLWLMTASGENPQQLTFGKGFETEPAFSPDQSEVIFSSNSEGNYEIFIVNIRSKKITRLTDNPALDAHPCFSQDGKKIFFVSDRSGSLQIWFMNRDGKELTRLTEGPDESTDPNTLNLGTKSRISGHRAVKLES